MHYLFAEGIRGFDNSLRFELELLGLTRISAYPAHSVHVLAVKSEDYPEEIDCCVTALKIPHFDAAIKSQDGFYDAKSAENEIRNIVKAHKAYFITAIKGSKSWRVTCDRRDDKNHRHDFKSSFAERIAAEIITEDETESSVASPVSLADFDLEIVVWIKEDLLALGIRGGNGSGNGGGFNVEKGDILSKASNPVAFNAAFQAIQDVSLNVRDETRGLTQNIY